MGNSNYIYTAVAVAWLTLSSGCAALLAPRASESMPEQLRIFYDDIKGRGKNGPQGYMTIIGTGSERLSIECIISKDGSWKTYARTSSGDQCTTVVQSKDALMRWKNNRQDQINQREPLEECTARALYDTQLTRAREAVENRTASFPYEEPLITGQVLGKPFRVPRP